MNIEIAEHARMSESGSSLLRLIQNNSFPVLDLLVREVVQNSLDAAAPDSTCVDMDFSIGTFSPSALNKHFEKIDTSLNKRFSKTSTFLSIRDCNTVGLTGPLHFDDAVDGAFGNLLKLVYEISMPQQNEGAGGSWGLGKTVYFRVGIGLVIYYSRIRTRKGFETRLAATLVEDQTLENAMLPAAPGTKLRRGIAWWGKSCGYNKTRPLVNDPEIQQILKVFGIPEYSGNETGTTVIIPYIDPSKLLTKPDDPTEVAWWHSDISDYFRVALQRWYAPRLMNPEYAHGKWLRAKINGKGITKREFLPLFMTIQNMYNRKADDGLYYKDVRTMNVLENGSAAGFIAYTKLNRAQLLMLPPANTPSPFVQAQIPDFDKEHNVPLVAFTRRPGMIVNYEVSGKWVEGIPQTTEDEFIIGLFVLDSNNRLKSPWGNIALEEYVRKSEKADHTSWADWTPTGNPSPQIIARIQRGARKAITDQFLQVVSDTGSRKNIGLGKALAELLLPPENFGRKASMPTPPPGGGEQRGHAGDNPKFTITSPISYSQDSISMDFELYLGKKSNTAQITLKISSEHGEIKANDWESKVGSPFPAQISNISFLRYRPEKKKGFRNLANVTLSSSKTSLDRDGMSFYLIKSKVNSVWNSIGVEVPECSGHTVCGRMTVKLADPQLQCVITI